MRARVAASSRADGASSMIFWWRRCRLHSRSPRWMVCPVASASTCTSMCRGRSMSRSSSRVSSPNADAATRRAEMSASGSSAASRTTTMPLPPPPADGFTSSGNPMPAAASMSSASVAPTTPGTVGTPRASTCSFERILSPITSSASTPGPMNTMPRVGARRRELGVLGEEPVSGVDGVGPGLLRGRDHSGDAEVALARARGSQAHGGIRHPDVLGVGIRVAVHRDRADAHRLQRADDAARDLAAIGHEHGAEGCRAE